MMGGGGSTLRRAQGSPIVSAGMTWLLVTDNMAAAARQKKTVYLLRDAESYNKPNRRTVFSQMGGQGFRRTEERRRHRVARPLQVGTSFIDKAPCKEGYRDICLLYLGHQYVRRKLVPCERHIS